jgi:hypothetical protein
VINSTPVKGSSADAGILIVPRKGLELPQRLAFDKWCDIGWQLSAVTTSSAWCLGDWLVYGETAYEGHYREAVAKTMLDYRTLRNYARVARRFALSRRRDTLSFGHHAEAVIPEAEPDAGYARPRSFPGHETNCARSPGKSLGTCHRGAEPKAVDSLGPTSSAPRASHNRAGKQVSPRT